MDELIRLLHEGGYSCVIRKEEIRTFTQRGVADLYDLLNQHPVFLHGAQVADKVVGKAAAALMVLGGTETGQVGVLWKLFAMSWNRLRLCIR